MSTQPRGRDISNPKLIFRISFFQDFFTIVEELTGDSPGVGLPKGFEIEDRMYGLFKRLQDKHNLTKTFLIDFESIKKIDEWKLIYKIEKKYKDYWIKNKEEISQAREYLSSKVDLPLFLEKLSKITNAPWLTKSLNVFLTLGYKDSGTYDRTIDAVRLGIHTDNTHYLPYTLYHELIHLHIIKHMKSQLREDEEEVLCRAIFKSIFKGDPIAEKHWKENLSEAEIESINKKSKELSIH